MALAAWKRSVSTRDCAGSVSIDRLSQHARIRAKINRTRGVYFPSGAEAPEFSRDVLEALREPLESGWCRVSRSWGAVDLPSRFQLVMAANPCPCGTGGTSAP